MQPSGIRRLILGVALTVVLLGCGGEDVRIEFEPTAAAGSPIELKLSLPAGLSMAFRMEMGMEMEMDVGGEDVTSDMDMDVEFTLAVESVDAAGVADVKLTHDAIAMEMKVAAGGQTQTMRYDSRTGMASPSQMSLMGEALGASIGMKVRPDGTAFGLTGIDELARRLGGGPTAQLLEGMSQSLEQMTMFFPKGPVDNGDTWTRTLELGSPMPMVMNLDCMLLEHDSSTATIGINAEMTVRGLLGNETVSSADVKGTMGGKATMNRATGFTTAMDMKMKIIGKMRAGGQDMELDADATIKYSRIR